jgi:ribosomal protein S27AE
MDYSKLIDALTKSIGTKPKRKARICVRCGSVNYLQRHHITYEPRKIAVICSKCHKLITLINTIASVVLGSKLSVDIRTKLWKWFVKFDGTVTTANVTGVLGCKDFKFTAAHYARISNRYKIK